MKSIELLSPHPVIVNFSNPYILQNEVLSEIISLNSSVNIQLVIITTNYFEPQQLSRTLAQFKEEKKISDYKIIRLYSKIQSPKGRPLQKYLMNLRKYLEIRKLYIETRPVLSLFHSTNELADLIGIGIARKMHSKIGILWPTSCEIPGEEELEKKITTKPFLILLMFRKFVYTYELFTKIGIYLLVMKNPNFKPTYSKGWFSHEKVDFVLCSNPHDAGLLRKQIQAGRIDVVEFNPPVAYDSAVTQGFILVLLPFFEDTKTAYAALSEINESHFAKFKGSKEKIFLKHHPRTSLKIQITFDSLFKAAYNHEEYKPPFMVLQELVDNSKLILCVGVTSAASFAFRRAPGRTIFAKSPALETYSEPNSIIYPSLSEYLLRVLREKAT
jgi:hypothetical protein